MADSERNFRSHYYEKVGFRAVEEKKSIEILLNEQPIKRDKLRQFCLRFGVPAMYRTHVWKLLLGILPLDRNNQDFVWNLREGQVIDLERAFCLLAPASLDSTTPQHKMLKMKLIEEGQLPLQEKFMDSDPKNQYYLSIAAAMCGLVTSDVDLYWISTRFFYYISQTVYPHLSSYPDYTVQCLKKEDPDQRLVNHLCEHSVLSVLPFMEWFHVCFSNVLPESSLERVWDKIIGGSNIILVYVAVAILLILRRPLLAMHTTHDMINYLKRIPEDCGDRIVNEAMDLLHKNGEQFCVKSESPALDSSKLSTSSSRLMANKQRRESPDFLAKDKAARTVIDSKNVVVDIGQRPQIVSEKPD